ncbi:MAG: hypothetical protein A2431_00045 [Candidatus Zambryskibacteria bacterium RIFOXYC1_FULL_39_10]|uniref:Uncharacterized protein n=1 Tax=Candidatus Zambryskibacteria bacterium RIFOXYC1_FULL_39_10 TaxID=1802779 RepID=A0A1G2UZL8_9BACT|nr:MAG: hypothetical protein A2431_00045 [Candidatus Zambryskibacteria bacterium RIFOXYC1_FULL_39_10]
MLNIGIEKDGESWLLVNYPELGVETEDDGTLSIKGLLIFDMVFSDTSGLYIIKPTSEHLREGYRIQDKYKIKILFKPSEYSNLPQVFEESGHIEALSKQKNIKLIDFHINPTGSACLCLNTKEAVYLPNGFNIPDFFNNLVIPFFYAQSYFRDFEKWPWGEYGHGMAGILESYLEYEPTKENIEMILDAIEKFCNRSHSNFNFYRERLRQKKIKGRNKCPVCNSGMRWEKCHAKSLAGFRKLKEHIDVLSIKI